MKDLIVSVRILIRILKDIPPLVILSYFALGTTLLAMIALLRVIELLP